MIRIETKGFRNTIASLKTLDPEANKELQKTLRTSAQLLQKESMDNVNDEGLSGWKRWRGGYDPSAIKNGIKITTAKRRKRGTAVSNVIGVANTNAAGVIWELAGRKSSGRPPRPGINPKTGWTYGNGAGLVAAIQRRSGRSASRIVWNAHDSSSQWNVDGQRDTLVAAVDKATRIVQSKLEALGG